MLSVYCVPSILQTDSPQQYVFTRFSDKSRSASNLRKISGSANLDIFLGLHLEKKLDLYHQPEKNPGEKLKKKSRCAGPEIFLRFETDLNFSRP